ncbi:MAG TPA: UbiD family decarboxylase [Alphaproteobacteria bacterium]|jgi:UbiD family decarboxylase|nr:UbiD family decarboxylase [Alphaproteobacteria bacterium]
MSSHWATLRDYVEGLDKAGKLVRVTTPVNKDTELHPLVRLQFRGLPESQRKAFLFENVVDSKGRKYDIPVLIGAMAGSADIYALGMCSPVGEISQKWRKALAEPIAPVTVTKAACQEVVIQGAELEQEGKGLGRLPIPISTPGFDNAPYTTASHWVSKDPDTGVHNLGNYRGMVKAENRIGSLPAMLGVGMRNHLDAWRKKKIERMPAAIVIGAPPHVTYTAVTRIPNDMCEYDVAGALAGKPVEVVKCLTQDLMVPADAEIVVEGTIPTTMLEMEGAFGEFPGYMAQRDYSWFMDVTAITMRKKPIYLTILSQLPPSESSKMRHIGRSEAARKFLVDAGFDNVSDVKYLECGGANAVVAVKIKKRQPDDAKKALRLLGERFIGKFIVAVDEDIDILDMENVMWAISYRSQPYRDVEIVDAPLFALDPSNAPPGTARGLVDGKPPRCTAILIDATMPWPYPPLSLPKKEFMDRAVSLWQELQLPALNLKNPWWGYSLGYWTEEEEREAELAVQGRHYETGEKQKANRRAFPFGETEGPLKRD